MIPAKYCNWAISVTWCYLGTTLSTTVNTKGPSTSISPLWMLLPLAFVCGYFAKGISQIETIFIIPCTAVLNDCLLHLKSMIYFMIFLLLEFLQMWAEELTFVLDAWLFDIQYMSLFKTCNYCLAGVPKPVRITKTIKQLISYTLQLSYRCI